MDWKTWHDKHVMIKIVNLPKLIYNLTQFLPKSQQDFFAHIDKSILKLISKGKGIKIKLF